MAQRQYEAGARLQELANKLGIRWDDWPYCCATGVYGCGELHDRRMRCGRWPVAMPVVSRSNVEQAARILAQHSSQPSPICRHSAA